MLEKDIDYVRPISLRRRMEESFIKNTLKAYAIRLGLPSQHDALLTVLATSVHKNLFDFPSGSSMPLYVSPKLSHIYAKIPASTVYSLEALLSTVHTTFPSDFLLPSSTTFHSYCTAIQKSGALYVCTSENFLPTAYTKSKLQDLLILTRRAHKFPGHAKRTRSEIRRIIDEYLS